MITNGREWARGLRGSDAKRMNSACGVDGAQLEDIETHACVECLLMMDSQMRQKLSRHHTGLFHSARAIGNSF